VTSPRTGRRRSGAAGPVALAAVLALAACSGGGETTGDGATNADADRAAVIEQVTDETIAPAYEAAVTGATEAAAAAAELCDAPSDAALAAARQAVGEAADAWAGLDPIDFGPIMDARADSQVGYPPDAAKIDDLLATSPPGDAEAVNTRTAADARGYGAAEHLLAGDLATFGIPARCAYLRAVSDNTAAVAGEVGAAWFEADPRYVDRVAGRGDDSIPHKEVLDIVVNMSLDALGADSTALAAEARAGSDPAPFLRDARQHLATVAALWGSAPGSGLRQMVEAELGDRLAEELRAAETASAGTDAGAALDAIDAARATLGTEVVAALDVVVGFSENDGDS
jgi:predicted lipoprotein